MKAKEPRSAFSLIEVAVVMAIMVILSIVALINFRPSLYRNQLNATAQKIVASLREAQSRAVAGESGVVWGVHFDNGTSTAPFYALFQNAYATSTGINYYSLPYGVQYATSSIASGGSLNVTFAQISGLPTATSSVILNLISGGSVIATSGVSISAQGIVSF